MAAFRHAIELGATGIETDVQRTKDGRLVLIHDESLKRTTGDGRLVKDVDYNELAGLDAGSWFSDSYAGERVPLLDELLELAKDTELILNLELKNGVVPYKGIEAEVIAMVQEHGLGDRIILSSFNHYSLVLCKKIASDIKTGVLYMEGLYQPWEYAKSIQANALHAYKFAVLPEWVQEAAEHGIAYHPFTVNDENELERLLAFGVSGIITDYPDRLDAMMRRSERS